MRDNIGPSDRIFRAIIGAALLVYAWFAHSWIALGFAIFTFYEALSSWCVLYSLIGKTTCPVSSHQTEDVPGSRSKIDARRLGLAGGIVWGLTIFLMTVVSTYTGYGAQFLHLMMDIYPDYTISLAGSISGLLYGFLDGFIGLFLIAWIYNKLS